MYVCGLTETSRHSVSTMSAFFVFLLARRRVRAFSAVIPSGSEYNAKNDKCTMYVYIFTMHLGHACNTVIPAGYINAYTLMHAC